VNRVGATTLGFGSRTIDEVFAGLAAVGAECCELNGRPGQHGGETLSAHRVLPLAKAHGIAVTSVGGYNDFTLPGETDEQVERLMVAVRLAGEIGAPLVRAMVGDLRHDVTLDSCFDTVVTGFRRAAASAASSGEVSRTVAFSPARFWFVTVLTATRSPSAGTERGDRPAACSV